ncbi:MAG: hypothetical protein IPG17_10455 [Sandaracinaceae bacterium]|nr:hypothetical protein [Sandaracinaceae bacterium]
MTYTYNDDLRQMAQASGAAGSTLYQYDELGRIFDWAELDGDHAWT